MKSQKVNIEVSWYEQLKDEFDKAYFSELTSFIKNEIKAGKNIYPPGALIFNAFSLSPFKQVKVIILGQDPYHNPNEAMGLSFSVPKGVKIPPSLRNIYKELHADIGETPPPHGDLTAWAQQGVFLLNAMLTVEKNIPGAHKNIGWQSFTDSVIHTLSKNRKNLVFMLWGNFAKNKRHLIDNTRHLILESAHPSPLAGNAFQGCKHFSKANEYLLSHGISPINWHLKP